MKYYSIAEMSKTLGISAQTLRNWDKSGKLKPHHTTNSGYRYYSQEQLNSILGIKENINKKIIGYCRVSSNKQKDDLQRQIQNLVEDLIQIVTVFSCRLQVKRANKAKKMIKEFIEDDTGEES